MHGLQKKLVWQNMNMWTYTPWSPYYVIILKQQDKKQVDNAPKRWECL